MNRILISICCILLLFSSSRFALAKNNGDWKMITDEATLLYQKGQYDRAEVLAKKALKLIEDIAGQKHPNVATSLTNLAEI